jgi:hypothetical protein
MRFESLDYYRINNPIGKRLIYYEGRDQEGLYKGQDEILGFGPINPSPSPRPQETLRPRSVGDLVADGTELFLEQIDDA